MDKYKVILVDDEEEVIDVIERKIHWDMLGFDVVGSANNGVKALELVEKLQPECLVCDHLCFVDMMDMVEFFQSRHIRKIIQHCMHQQYFIQPHL